MMASHGEIDNEAAISTETTPLTSRDAVLEFLGMPVALGLAPFCTINCLADGRAIDGYIAKGAACRRWFVDDLLRDRACPAGVLKRK